MREKVEYQGELFDSISQEYDEVSLSLSRNYGIVNEHRNLNLTESSKHLIQNFPKSIQSNSFHIISKTDPSAFDASITSVREPNYKEGIELLAQHLNKKVTVAIKKNGGEEKIEGTIVLQSADDFVLRVEGSYFKFKKSDILYFLIGSQSFEALSNPINYNPSLEISVACLNPGDHVLNIMYQNNLIHWDASYCFKVFLASKTIQVSGNFIITNRSSKSYNQAQVTIGDQEGVSRGEFVLKGDSNYATSGIASKLLSFASYDPGESDTKVYEYRPPTSFQLPNLIDLPSDTVNTIRFIDSNFIFTSYFLFNANNNNNFNNQLEFSEHIGSRKSTGNFIEVISFMNESNYYIPAGKANVLINDQPIPTQEEEENKFEHFPSSIHKSYQTAINGTSKGGLCIIPIRSLPSVTCQKERKAFKKDDKKKTISETYLLTITNLEKNGAVVVEDSFLRTKNWELDITKTKPDNFELFGQYSARWSFPNIAVGETVEVRYTVNYSWGSDIPLEDSSLEKSVVESKDEQKQTPQDDDKQPAVHSTSFFSKLLNKRR